jgi:hypothetical protein
MDLYLEELVSGESFVYNKDPYIMTQDFKKNGNRLCISLTDGTSRWLSANEMISKISIYIMDNDNNFMPLKTENSKPTNI